MFDDSKTISFNDTQVTSPKFHWSAMPLETLLRCMDEIRAVLPPTNLSKMNMEEEMILQYRAIRELQNSVLDDDSIPANQRAQVANAVAASLNKLADLQKDIYMSERFKLIENLLIRTLGKLPEDLAASFLDEYEKILQGLSE